MILTCPACASRYFVDAAKMPPQGRTVRCSACTVSWHADACSEPLELTASHDPEGAAIGTPGAETSTTAAEALPTAFRQKVQAQQRTRRAVATGVVWAGLAAVCASLILAAVVFRVQVVRLWPRTAGAYAAVRLPVNPLGLAPDSIQAGQGLQNGHVALIVTGAERNIETQPRRPAALRVSVYDKGGARLLSRVVHLTPEPIPAGGGRAFTVSILDPPMAGAQVGVDFMVEPDPARRRQPLQLDKPVAGLHLRGRAEPPLPVLSTPRLARSVPAGSRYALPVAAQPQSD